MIGVGYPWRRTWKPTPIFLLGKFHGQKRLVSYSPWDHKESDTTEWLIHTHTHTHTHTHSCRISLHNRLVFWKEGDLTINAGCSSGTVKVEKDSKGKREKTISYFTATLKNTSYSQGLLGCKWYRHFKNVHGQLTKNKNWVDCEDENFQPMPHTLVKIKAHKNMLHTRNC